MSSASKVLETETM